MNMQLRKGHSYGVSNPLRRRPQLRSQVENGYFNSLYKYLLINGHFTLLLYRIS